MLKYKKNKKEKEVKLFDIKKLRYSIEIEVEFKNKENGQKLIDRGRTLKGWEIKSDGSLDGGCELSPENSNHLHYNSESLMQIKEILALIRVHRGYINPETCGFHIHVNAKNFTDKQILVIIREFIRKQRYVIKRFKVHQTRLDSTCKLLPKTELHTLTEKAIHQFRNNTSYRFSSFGYIDDKYYSMSASHLPKSDYETIEFRLFGGTLNFREIKERIYWTLNFIKDSIERDE